MPKDIDFHYPGNSVETLLQPMLEARLIRMIITYRTSIDGTEAKELVAKVDALVTQTADQFIEILRGERALND